MQASNRIGLVCQNDTERYFYMKQFGKGKTIALVMPEDHNLYQMIIKNLEHYGFNVIFRHKSKYESVLDLCYVPIIRKLRKIFMKDKHYKERVFNKRFIDKLNKHVKNTGKKIDYALFIRGDECLIDLLYDLKLLSNKMINYQWDGVDVFPSVLSRITFFDRFFIFDRNDLIKYPQYNLSLTTNFYFDFDDVKKHITDNKLSPSLYFLGGHAENRIDSIKYFLNMINNSGYQVNFYIQIYKNTQKSYYQEYNINVSKSNISFNENIKLVQQNTVLVDFVNSRHNGLSFRTFEALYYGKKLITTNRSILTYDFYHPDNIFVWDGVHLEIEELQAFLAKPYMDLPNKIVQKYSFENWIKAILGIKG
ncbi:hypothetical protein [Lonepinella sp. BR2882]|uniref:hypothetical protein n=1 Tax=Lonepinella sp. BR2882 TaxID=3095283 RepID=UPI003F6E048C